MSGGYLALKDILDKHITVAAGLSNKGENEKKTIRNDNWEFGLAIKLLL